MTFNRSSGALYEKKGRRSSGFNHTTVFPELRQGWRFEGREESERDLSARREKSDSRRYSSSSTPKQRKSGCLNSRFSSCTGSESPASGSPRLQRRLTSKTKSRQLAQVTRQPARGKISFWLALEANLGLKLKRDGSSHVWFFWRRR